MTLAVALLVVALAAGQSPEEKAARLRAEEYARRDRENARKAEEVRRQRELELRKPLEAPKRTVDRPAESAEQIDRRHFLAAYEKFQSARLEVLAAVDSQGRLKPPAQRLGKSMAGLFDYLNRISKAPAPFDSKELAGFTQAQLQEEFLRAMNDVSSHLESVFKAEDTGEVDLQVLTALPTVRSELHKMDWIANRLK